MYVCIQVASRRISLITNIVYISLTLSFYSCSIQQSLDLECKANYSTHSWTEKKAAKNSAAKSRAAAPQLTIALGRMALALFIPEQTTELIFKTKHFYMSVHQAQQQDYICMELTIKQACECIHNCLIYMLYGILQAM